MKTAVASSLLSAFVAFGAMAAASSISTISPASGLTRGGELVHIHGVGDGVAAVYFGGAPATIVYHAGVELIVIAPPHAAGPVTLEIDSVFTPQVMLANGYIYQEPRPSSLAVEPDPQADQVRFLVPVAISTGGAFGSSWKSELVVYNGNRSYNVLGAEPFATAVIPLSRPAGNPGMWLTVLRPDADNMMFSLRVHDAAHDAESAGADIPVVPATQFRRSVILPGVLSDPKYRVLLRVYGYDTATVNVLVRDDATGTLLSRRTLQLTGAPAYGELPVDGGSAKRVRAEVSPSAGDTPPIWAFASITNNVTQQVTTVTPNAVIAPVAVPPFPTLPLGRWAGPNACMNVSDADVTLSAGCAVGEFAPPALNADGGFETDGTFTIEAGPTPLNRTLTPAHFSGVVQGTLLTLTVTSERGTSVLQMTLGSTGPCPYGCP